MTYSAPIHIKYHYETLLPVGSGMDFDGRIIDPMVHRHDRVSSSYYQGKKAASQVSPSQRLEIGRLPIMLRSEKCHLHGKTDAQLTEMGECPLDPGGYFVIDGTEKALMMQENMSHNRIIVEKDPKGKIQAAVTSATNENKSRITVSVTNKDGYHTTGEAKLPHAVEAVRM